MRMRNRCLTDKPPHIYTHSKSEFILQYLSRCKSTTGKASHPHSLLRTRLNIIKMLFMFSIQSNWIIPVEGIQESGFPKSVQSIFAPWGGGNKNSKILWSERTQGKITRRSHCCSQRQNQGFSSPHAMLKHWIWVSCSKGRCIWITCYPVCFMSIHRTAEHKLQLLH